MRLACLSLGYIIIRKFHMLQFSVLLHMIYSAGIIRMFFLNTTTIEEVGCVFVLTKNFLNNLYNYNNATERVITLN